MESIANQKKSLKAILEEKKNHRRVVLLYGRDDAQRYLINQQHQFHTLSTAMAERDIDLVVLVASTLQEPDRWFLMHSEFELNPAEDFIGWLIGKDGEVKHRFFDPIDPNEIFRLVDSMPMRNQEIKEPWLLAVFDQL